MTPEERITGRTAEELAAIRDYYDNTCIADEITAAFDNGLVTYHDPRTPEKLINDLIDEWIAANSAGRSLPEYLGMTNDQYGRWVAQKLPAAELAEWAKNRKTR